MNRIRVIAIAWMSAVATAAAILACIPESFTFTDVPNDGSIAEATPDTSSVVTDGMTNDGGPDAAASALCDRTKEFGDPVLLTPPSTTGMEGTVRLARDERTMYLDALRDGSYDIFSTTRTEIGAAFGPLVAIPGAGVNTATAYEYSPYITEDGLTLFFDRSDPPATYSSIMQASRGAPDGAFNAPTEVKNLGDASLYVGNVFVRGDRNTIWFAKVDGVIPNDSLDIFSATLDNNTKMYTVTKPTKVSSSDEESSPTLSKDGLVLYFASRRPAPAGVPGVSGQNIWMATRAQPNSELEEPQLVARVNTAADEYPSWISEDDCRLYFASNRTGIGLQDIYVASRPASR